MDEELALALVEELSMQVRKLEEVLAEDDFPTWLHAQLWRRIREARGTLAVVERDFLNKAVNSMDGDHIVAPDGLYELEEAWSYTGWDNEQLKPMVLRWLRFDPDTGAERTQAQIIEAIQELVPLSGSGMRRTAIKKVIGGAALDEFSVKKPRPALTYTPTQE